MASQGHNELMAFTVICSLPIHYHNQCQIFCQLDHQQNSVKLSSKYINFVARIHISNANRCLFCSGLKAVKSFSLNSKLFTSLCIPGTNGPWSHSTGNGSQKVFFFSLDILRCVSSTQVVSRWWVPFEDLKLAGPKENFAKIYIWQRRKACRTDPYFAARGPALILDCKLLSEPMLECCQFDPYEQNSVKYRSKFIHLPSRKWICMLSAKCWPFCLGLNVLTKCLTLFPQMEPPCLINIPGAMLIHPGRNYHVNSEESSFTREAFSNTVIHHVNGFSARKTWLWCVSNGYVFLALTHRYVEYVPHTLVLFVGWICCTFHSGRLIFVKCYCHESSECRIQMMIVSINIMLEINFLQRFRIIYFLTSPWHPWAMILMGPRALGMGAITDVFIHWNFKDASPGRR